MRISFLLVVSAATAVERRPVTGLCPGVTLVPVSPRDAGLILNRIHSDCTVPFSVECVQRGILIGSMWSPAALPYFTERIRASRMSIPAPLLTFLVEFRQSSGEPVDVGALWETFKQAHPDTTSDCHTMASLYQVLETSTDVLIPNTDRVDSKYSGEMMYLELRQAALIPFRRASTNNEVYADFEIGLELYSVRRIIRGGIHDPQAISEEFLQSIGRTLRYIDPSDVPRESSNDAKFFNDVCGYAWTSWGHIVTVPEWLRAVPSPSAVYNVGMRHPAGKSVLEGEYRAILPTRDELLRLEATEKLALVKGLSVLVERIGVPVVLFDNIVRAFNSNEPPVGITPVRADWIRRVLVPNAGKTVGSIGLVILYWKHAAVVLPPRAILDQIIRAAYPSVETEGISTPVKTPRSKKRRVSEELSRDPLDILANVANDILGNNRHL